MTKKALEDHGIVSFKGGKVTRTSFPPSSIRRDNLHFTSLGGTSQQFGMLHVFNGLNNIVLFFFGKLKFQAQERSDIGSNLMMN